MQTLAEEKKNQWRPFFRSITEQLIEMPDCRLHFTTEWDFKNQFRYNYITGFVITIDSDG